MYLLVNLLIILENGRYFVIIAKITDPAVLIRPRKYWNHFLELFESNVSVSETFEMINNK
jgi:hypothetical protein